MTFIVPFLLMDCSASEHSPDLLCTLGLLAQPDGEVTGLLLCTGGPCFIVLPSTALCRYCIFYNWKVWGNPASSESTKSLFQQCELNSMFLSHSDNSPLFQTSPLLLYLLQESVTSDLWCYSCKKRRLAEDSYDKLSIF